MRVVVTGGAGFIGAALVRRLLAEGHRAVLDNFGAVRGQPRAVKSTPDITVIEGDVVNPADMQRCHDALGGVDLVHHLAAINGTKWFHEAAMDGSMSTSTAPWSPFAMHLNGGRFVLASSPKPTVKTNACRSWRRRQPISIGCRPPALFYGASKYLDEVLSITRFRKAGRAHRPSVQRLRCRHARRRLRSGGGMFFQAVRNNSPWPFTVMGVKHAVSPTSTTSLTGFIERIRWTWRGRFPLHGCSFNLGSPEEVSIRSLAEAVNRTVVPWQWISSWAAGITAIERRCPIPMQQNACWDGPVSSRFRTGWNKFGRRFRPARSA